MEGQTALLVVADRLQHHLLPDALPGSGRHAPSLCRLPDAVHRFQRHRLRWRTGLRSGAGVLHLCGFKDKSKKDIEMMRFKEAHYLNLYVPRETLGELIN